MLILTQRGYKASYATDSTAVHAERRRMAYLRRFVCSQAASTNPITARASQASVLAENLMEVIASIRIEHSQETIVDVSNRDVTKGLQLSAAPISCFCLKE
jgi:hypothetical protein